jgi:alpha,alpha-trehalase
MCMSPFNLTIWLLHAQENRSVVELPERHSLLPIPYGVVVPGARFRELYYW